MRKKVVKREVIIAVIVFVLLLGAYIVLNTMLSFTAYSRYDALCAKAKEYYDLEKLWLESDREEDLPTFVEKNKWNDKEGYPAFCCEGGKYYTLYSLNKFDSKDIRMPVKEQEIAKLCNIFTHNKAIGFYCPDSETDIQTNKQGHEKSAANDNKGLSDSEIAQIKETALCLYGTLKKYEKKIYFIVENENGLLSVQEKVRVEPTNKNITFDDCEDGDRVTLWVGTINESLPPGVDVLYYEKDE